MNKQKKQTTQMRVSPTSIGCVCLLQSQEKTTHKSINRSCHSDIFERMYETKDRANSSDRVRNGLVFWGDEVLANNYGVLIFEDILRDIKVERSGTFANTSRGIVMRAMTWTIVTTEVARISNGNTTLKDECLSINGRLLLDVLT